MKKITYCKECGSKIVDGSYCPICGSKINNKVEKMDKNNRTRNILLVILAITIIAGVLIVGSSLLNHNQRVQITDSASLEIPVGNGIKEEIVNGTNVHKFTNGKGDVVMSFNSKETSLASLFGFALLKEVAVGGKDNENQIHETTVNGTKVYSIATRNDTTHDNILISTHDKERTMKIYQSIKYNASNTTNNNATNKTINDTTTGSQQSGNTANNNQQKALAYRSDGSPMYDYREVDSYMVNKYGDNVDFHIQDNSYISHDGYRESHQETTPYDTGGRGSGGSYSSAS